MAIGLIRLVCNLVIYRRFVFTVVVDSLMTRSSIEMTPDNVIQVFVTFLKTISFR